MKHKILDFLHRTHKATAAVLGGATAVASATFIPEPWNHYASTTVVVLTWVVTYAVPYFSKIVEEFPYGGDEWAHPMSEEEYQDFLMQLRQESEPIQGEVLPPVSRDTVEMNAVIARNTAGIAVIEGDDAREDVLTVDAILARLRTEGQ